MTRKIILIALIFSVIIAGMVMLLVKKGQMERLKAAEVKQMSVPQVQAPKPVSPPPLPPPPQIRVTPGMYAISVEIKNISKFNNYSPTDAYVNVILTYLDNTTKTVVSKTLITNARVLALSGNTSALLEVTAQEAEILSSVTTFGTISLIYSSGFDNSKVRSAHGTDGLLRPSIYVLQLAIKKQFPHAQINLSYQGNSLTMSGSVSSEEQQKQIATTVDMLLPPYVSIIDTIKIEPPQVLLQVKVLEISKKVQDQLGLDWSALFNGGNVRALGGTSGTADLATAASTPFLQAFVKTGNLTLQGLLQALRSDNLVTILAEPNLLTSSGKPASFLSGGEFPILQSQGLGVTTTSFDSYGVSLEFTPTVEADNTIRLEVAPEVSSVDFSGAVVSNNNKMPLKTTRRAKTTVRLRSGQSYAIAGLLQNGTKIENKDIKGLASAPIIGRFFQSTNTEIDSTDLVIIVTPVLVNRKSANAEYITNGRLAERANKIIDESNKVIDTVNRKKTTEKSATVKPIPQIDNGVTARYEDDDVEHHPKIKAYHHKNSAIWKQHTPEIKAYRPVNKKIEVINIGEVKDAA